MKRTVVTALLFTACCCVAATAQTFSLTTGRMPLVSLDGLWRFHPGDNPAWASPNFDDSNWPLLRSDKNWYAQGYKGLSGFAWYRFTIQEPDASQPFSLLLTRIMTSYRVYANGKLIGGFGYMPPHSLVLVTRRGVYDLPRAGHQGPQTEHIAIRVWHAPLWAPYEPGGPMGPGNFAGASTLIHQQFEGARSTVRVELAGFYAYSILACIFGLLALGLFLFRPAEREYLWFALVLLASGTNVANGIAKVLSMIPIESSDYIASFLDVVFYIAALLFFSKVLRARRGIWWWAAFVSILLESLTTPLYTLHLAPVAVSSAASAILAMPAQVWILAMLLRRAVRRNADARLLLAPVLLGFGYILATNLLLAAFQFGWLKHEHYLEVTVLHEPYPLGSRVIVLTIFVAAMMLFLIRRFSLARREEERLSGEFAAARNMQSLLLPASTTATPGFHVENVYLPASEVGGDFYQVLPGDDGSLLIVVGDVSGKGLQAAMTVSAIVGALRGCTLRAPAKVLAYLNHAMRGQVSGFFTCCAALVETDGKLTIANAGHLAPYLNGEELAVSPGLPLGIADGTAYSETSYQLGENDRLTFLSDGVVEARDAKGELYGFARTAALSIQPAKAIAETARAYGQEDDITVLTVARTA